MYCIKENKKNELNKKGKYETEKMVQRSQNYYSIKAEKVCAYVRVGWKALKYTALSSKTRETKIKKKKQNISEKDNFLIAL